MNTLEAIHARHSVGNVDAAPIPRSQIEQLLDAAVQAPNHYKVRPWRFVVITGKAREGLGQAMVKALRRKHPEVEAAASDKEAAKPLRAPLIIAVGVDRPEDPRVIEIENVCAVAAACENILLAATDLGLASYWRTGESARDPEVKEFLGFQAEQDLIAFLYIGRPVASPDAAPRPGFDDRTVWMN
ncbi:MAG TPA: nitroreductase [Anaerolineales bacterium]|nr:nitroreductase [Anaerolineales bacterium]